ncbi:MAG: HAD family hydrolase [Gammaproteobacteria bacterium]|nr:HAD family hydrolase [Gammaproteobacteria bacterium]
MKIEAVLFDLDETLHARAPSIVRFARRLYAEASLELSEAAFVATVLARDERGRRPTEGLYTWLATHFELGKTAGEVVDAYRTTAWDRPVLYPDAKETLRRLRPLRLGIVTNGGELSQTAKIANSGLDTLTDAVAISGVLDMRKPEPAIFHEICGRLGVAPSRCVMVGDSPEHDVGGGRAAGMRTIWVERGAWPSGLARDYDASVARVSDVVEVVERWDAE